jgi:hypothetical protein
VHPFNLGVQFENQKYDDQIREHSPFLAECANQCSLGFAIRIGMVHSVKEIKLRANYDKNAKELVGVHLEQWSEAQ